MKIKIKTDGLKINDKFICKDGAYTIAETCAIRQKYIPDIFGCEECARGLCMENVEKI